MESKDKFSFLRTVLKTFGLSAEATNDIIDRILDFLSDKEDSPNKKLYPYCLRDNFLTPAEHDFYLALKTAISDVALISPKVSLGDLFYVKSADNSVFRTFTNKIDRKHVDFLLCDPATVRPILGIELDDKSHQRPDRQERDEFVENVFKAAKLPLVRFPVKHTFSPSEINNLLRPYFPKKEPPAPNPKPAQEKDASPNCPKCGSAMVLRTAKSGANQGEKFWGCSNFPNCRKIMSFEGLH